MKKRIAPILLVAAFALSACAGTPAPAAEIEPFTPETGISEVVAEGRLLPSPSAELAFVQYGTVAEILVEPGQEVPAGDTIARLENREILAAEVARARATLLQAEQAFNTSEAEALTTLVTAHEAVRQARYELDYFDIPTELKDMTQSEALTYTLEKVNTAREAFEPYRYREEQLEYELKQKNPNKPKVYRDTAKLYKKRLDDAWADYNKAIQWGELEANLQRAQVNLENAQRDFDSLVGDAERSLSRARYEAAQANLEAAQANLSNAELNAPFRGTVLSMDLTVGEVIQPGLPVVFLADTGNWIVETTDLAEIDIASVATGMRATIKLDAFPGEEFTATVTEIDPVGREYLGDMTYQVTLKMDESDPRLMWNMTATVIIELE
ncbi:MAG: efflux RND transporter periplasmic adaptor subunit [Anaerolineales bacterium]|nr:efflux RND transporter periplasmic adaptor subunit [Anaerolineales bacterium]